MRKNRLISLFTAAVMAACALMSGVTAAAQTTEVPRLTIVDDVYDAGTDDAKQENTVQLFGCSVPADVKKACFITGGEFDSMIEFYKDYAEDYGENYFYCPNYSRIECAEIAEKLPNLTSLSIIKSDVKNIEALSGMKKLRTLEFHMNEGTEDISFLTSLPKLTTFKITQYYGYEIKDLTPVSSLTKLKKLQISCDSERDLTFLKGLKNLKNLDLDFEFSSIAPLSKLTKLKTLRLNSSSISDISPLAKLKNLTTLEILERNHIKDISAIGKLTKLKSLMLHTMDVGSVAVLSKLKKLESLSLMYVKCSDARKVVSGLTTLKSLDITDVDMGRDCGFLKKLKNLETLFMLYPGFTSIDGIQYCTNLKNLWLQDDSLSDISPFKKLKKLEVLNISNSGVTDISALAKLKNIRTLYIQGNSISDYSALTGMKKLEYLWTDGLPGDVRSAVLEANPNCIIF